ncbi:hypothetical protein LIER_03018 [Lithospermum erythrorhizon]|uniref:Uncharacterized protein n=1 Tax=Lithospermum erythrorhizon TaxID=34254 RepID=A0AAV3NWE5_LITER
MPFATSHASSWMTVGLSSGTSKVHTFRSLEPSGARDVVPSSTCAFIRVVEAKWHPHAFFWLLCISPGFSVSLPSHAVLGTSSSMSSRLRFLERSSIESSPDFPPFASSNPQEGARKHYPLVDLPGNRPSLAPGSCPSTPPLGLGDLVLIIFHPVDDFLSVPDDFLDFVDIIDFDGGDRMVFALGLLSGHMEAVDEAGSKYLPTTSPEFHGIPILTSPGHTPGGVQVPTKSRLVNSGSAIGLRVQNWSKRCPDLMS